MSHRMGVLHAEHVLLGASFEPDELTGLLGVSSYAAEKTPEDGGALLCDLTGTTYRLVSGDAAEALVSAGCAGERLAVGRAAFEAVLTGDAALAAAPLVCRTGDHEYVLVDPSASGAAAAAWLAFLAGVEQDGFAPYAGTGVEDASGMLVPLLLAGPAAAGVLSDYLAEGAALPAAGSVAGLSLDAIFSLVARLPEAPLGGSEAYLVLVPAAQARALWRSLLSFTEVEPVGHTRLRGLAEERLPWGERLAGDDAVRPRRSELASWGLVRAGDDFVGARGIAP